ncbi:MAG: adenosylmethionine--8-amino-7-oxononanoate transaminase [Spirochaetota bacterium]|nr:adenosylmethionine--8-amino-7-oxononanoate transaminase [Spirochaetota bacterium]
MHADDKRRLVGLDHRYVWHPFTQMRDWLREEPLFIERGDGNYLIDVDGKRYLDGVSSLWANVHGHNRKEINDAIKNQLDKISHTTMLGLANVPATLLAEKLVKISPKGLNKVFYSDNGSTAVEIALKMAYQYWKLKSKPRKAKFIKLKEAYHGDTVGSVSLGGIDIFHNTFSSLLFETFNIPSPFYYHSNFTSEDECMNYSLSILRSTLDKNHNEIAGLFIEPYIQGAGGMIVYPKGFMKEVYTLCKEYEVLFIADEVATGFGRTGVMFACEEDRLEPDIMSIAKGISGGYLPLAATLTTDEIYNTFLGEYSEYKTFYHGHTYTGNPLACSAAIASLDIFEDDNVLKHLQEKIIFIKEMLNSLWKLDCVGDIRQKGLMIGIELLSDKRKKEFYDPTLRVGHRVCMEARKHNLIIRPLGDVIVLMPPLSISMEEIKMLIDVVYTSVVNVTNKL